MDARPGAVAPVLAQADADVVLIATRLAPPEQAPAGSPGAEASGRPTVKASDVIHAVLTDAGLVVTNRTSWAVDLRVRLGRADAPDADLASLDLTLRPGGSATVPVADLGVVGALPGPEAVVRHWSHETGVVFEGGERRINGVDVRYRLPDGTSAGVASHGSHRGLVVGVAGGDIARDLGANQDSLPRLWAGEGRTRLSLAGLVELLARRTP